MSLNKRDVLLALAALAAGAALPAAAQTAREPDLAAGRAVGEAYRAAHPTADLARLRNDLLPGGFTAEAVDRLRARAAADFRAARVFIFKGWRLSETEAQLFALLTSAS
ncbi:MAG TPA: hypothetical protein VEF55_04485 [Candidatus Binatia bacterium]|nr:hypothetical protein [Candidatus Binatia bacterium]